MLRAAANWNYIIPRTNRRLGDRAFLSLLTKSAHRPQERYLLNGRFQTTLEDLALQTGL